MFKFTADHEEPFCHRCDNMCTMEKYTCQKCGPEYGWNNYIRTVEDYEITTDEDLLIKLLKENN